MKEIKSFIECEVCSKKIPLGDDIYLASEGKPTCSYECFFDASKGVRDKITKDLCAKYEIPLYNSNELLIRLIKEREELKENISVIENEIDSIKILHGERFSCSDCASFRIGEGSMKEDQKFVCKKGYIEMTENFNPFLMIHPLCQDVKG